MLDIKNLTITIVALLSYSSLNAQEIPTLANIWQRDTISLNGNWNYIVDVQEMGFYDYRMKETPWGFFLDAKAKNPSDLIEYDFDKSPKMTIPTDWNTADDRLFFYEGTVWFRKTFNYTKKVSKRTILYFAAVNYQSVVYVNGKKVGTHISGFTPFNYDVTDFVKDGMNSIVVKVDNKRHPEDIPTQIFDWWNYGGITRDVMLVDVNDTYIENYKIQLSAKEKGYISCKIKLNHAIQGIQLQLVIPELKVRKQLVTDHNGIANLTFKARPQLWSPSSPKLYQIAVTLGNETIKDEIGFRTIETKGQQILLNGSPVFLKGVSIHDEAAITHGRITSTKEAHQLLSWATEMGCNFVRLAHYPHNEKTVREAERMGIMVWDEIPCYWTIDWENEQTYLNAQRQLQDMILRDQNRANVIIWSVANETPHSEARDTFLGKLVTFARGLDDTRLISLAMEVTSAKNYINTLNDNMHEYVDVVSFNQYVGWYRDVNDAQKMQWVIPYDKPIIVSEFGGGALAGYHGAKEQRWTEEFQEDLYRENLAMLGKIDGLAGTVPWILTDFYSPRRPLHGVQDWHNRKGLISEKGEKKKAFYVVQEWYKTR